MNILPKNKRKRSHRERYNKNKKIRWKSNTTFDSSKNRTQGETRGLSTKDKVYYLEKLWISTSLCFTDSKTSKKVQQSISIRDLLIEFLLEKRKSRKNSFESIKIPSNFLSLIDTEIISPSPIINKSTSKCLWIAFGKWLGFKINDKPFKKKQIQHHIKLKWKKFKAATSFKKSQKKKKNLIAFAPKVNSIDELIHFRHVKNMECITDLNGRTLIH